MIRAPLLKRLTRHIHAGGLLRKPASGKESPRVNQLGIQYLSQDVHRKVFPKNPPNAYKKVENEELLELTKQHLQHNKLLGKKTNISEPISIPNLPELVGKSSLDEHFTRIGFESSQPYLRMAEMLFSRDTNLPKRPAKWELTSGWLS